MALLKTLSGDAEGALDQNSDKHLETFDRPERFPDHRLRVDVTVESICENQVACVAYPPVHDKVTHALFPHWTYLNHLPAAQDLLTGACFDRLYQVNVIERTCDRCRNVDVLMVVETGWRVHRVCPASDLANLIQRPVCSSNRMLPATFPVNIHTVAGCGKFCATSA